MTPLANCSNFLVACILLMIDILTEFNHAFITDIYHTVLIINNLFSITIVYYYHNVPKILLEYINKL